MTDTSPLHELPTDINSSSVNLTDSIIRSRSRCNNIDTLKTLNLWGCNLTDIFIISKLSNLRVLSLSSNFISDLSPLKCCTKLRELYIRNNSITDFAEIKHLTSLKCLRAIWLSDNPCISGRSIRDYTQELLCIFPKLKFIDGQTVDQIMESVDKEYSNLYKAIMLLIQDLSPDEMYQMYNEIGKSVFMTQDNIN